MGHKSSQDYEEELEELNAPSGKENYSPKT